MGASSEKYNILLRSMIEPYLVMGVIEMNVDLKPKITNMKKEHFNPYKDMIIRCIDSCVNPDQLVVCHDMMDRFNEQFTYSVTPKERADALDELSGSYLQKQAELAV